MVRLRKRGLGRLILAYQQVPFIPIPNLKIGVTPASNPHQVAFSLQILLLLTVLTLAPSILVLMTSFTRIIIVLSFLQQALGTQQIPSSQILIGFSLFLTYVTMYPTLSLMNKQALQPYLHGKLSEVRALKKASGPLRQFMLKQTREKDLALILRMAHAPQPKTPNDVSLALVIPAFAMSEFKTAFQIGFVLFIPFMIIDMVVASTLMSLGMLMLPPVMISLPFKILLFVLVDGWRLVVGSLWLSFK